MPTELQRKWIQALAAGTFPQSSTVEKRSVEDVQAPGGEPAPAPSAIRLSGSVGAGGRNAKEDVRSVQAALNLRTKAGLAEDGNCGKKTIDAITAFQKKLKFKSPDGRVDPGGPTERALNGSAAAAPNVDERSDGKDKDSDQSGLKKGAPVKASEDDAEGGGQAGRDPEPDFSRLARQIHDATEGVGTDEEAIFAALRELKGSPQRRARLGEVYRKMFGDDLEEVLRDELNDAERAKADDAANRGGGGGGPDFESLARQIHDATEGVGTDEEAVNAALSQVKGKPEHMAKLRAVYRSMFGENLDDVLRAELSGKELKKAQGNLDPAREVIPDKGFDEVSPKKSVEEVIPKQGFDEVETIESEGEVEER